MKKEITTILLLLVTFSLFSQTYFINEDFNSASPPAGWNRVNNYWSYGIDGASNETGFQNINGTRMAYYDDWSQPATPANGSVIIESPSFSSTSQQKLILELDYNFKQNNILPDFFKIDVGDTFNNWTTVYQSSDHDCGGYEAKNCIGRLPHLYIDITPYRSIYGNEIRFVFNDGGPSGLRSFYAGIDNVKVYAAASNDVGVLSIENISDYEHSSQDSIYVKIKNYGTSTATNFEVIFDVDDTTLQLRDTITTNILAGDTLNYTFLSTIDFSTIKNYQLKAYTKETLDTTYFNDTIIKIISSKIGQPTPYLNNFETLNDWTVDGIEVSWELGLPTAPIIDSAASLNNAYVTNLSGLNNYEESSFLVSPLFELPQNGSAPKVSFNSIREFVPIYDSLSLQYSIDTGKTWQMVYKEYDSKNWYNFQNRYWRNSSNGWVNSENTLTSLIGIESVQFRFKFNSVGRFLHEGAGIDDFSIDYLDSVDMRIIDLVYPSNMIASSCGLDNEKMVIQLKNEGSGIVDSLIVFYRINGGVLNTDTIAINSIPYSKSIKYQLNSSYNFTSLGNYNIDIWIRANGDSNLKNDSILNKILIHSPNHLARQLPLIESFDPPNFVSGSTFRNEDDSIGNEWIRKDTLFSFRIANSQKNMFGGSGPLFDHSGDSSNFVYTEYGSGVQSNDIAWISSPCVDLRNKKAVNVDYWYHRYGSSNMTPLRIDVFDGKYWQNVDSIFLEPQSSHQSPWTFQTVAIDDYIGQKALIRFRANERRFLANNCAIDDVSMREPDNYDIKLNKIISPISDCIPDDTIRFEIFNNGILPITGTIPFHYQVDNGSVITENLQLNTILNRQHTAQLNFTVPYNFEVPNSIYELKIWTTYSADTNPNNDSIQMKIMNTSLSVIDYFEDFENFIDGDDCGFITNRNNRDIFKNSWVESSQTDFRWNVQDGVICGNRNLNTGPNKDHTTGNGKFIYTNTTISGNSNMVAFIESPCLDFTNRTTAAVDFWYHRYGNDIGTFFIEVFTNGVWSVKDIINGSTQSQKFDPWKLKTVNLNQFAGQVIKVRLRGAWGGGINGFTAIDDIQFYSPISQDSKIVDSKFLEGNCISTMATIDLTVNNLGTDTIAPFALKTFYSIYGVKQIADSNLTTLQLDSNYTMSFNINGVDTLHDTEILVWTELLGDTNNTYDTVRFNYTKRSKLLSYSEGFENITTLPAKCASVQQKLNFDWEVASGDFWIASDDSVCYYNGGATPSSSTGPDSAFSGSGFMYFEPGFNSTLDTAVLTSTCIDLRNQTSAMMEFNFHMFGAGIGKLHTEVLFNNSWIRLDSIIGQQQVSMTSPWGLKLINLNAYLGQVVQVRFIAYEHTNNSISQLGNIALDNIRFFNPLSTNTIIIEKNDLKVKLYPNPNKGNFKLDIYGFSGNQLEATIIDLKGRVVFQKKLQDINQNIIQKEFNLHNQPRGVYFIVLRDEKNVSTHKFIIT